MSIVNTGITLSCIELARNQIGIAKYDWFEENSNQLVTVNCYTFIQEIFAQHDIPLPQNLLGQLQAGEIVQPPYEKGSLIFTKGPWEGLGHNGLLTDIGSVIHASKEAGTVVEESLANFLCTRKFKCVVRIIAGHS